MKYIIVLVLFSINTLFGIELKSNQWNLIGAQNDINMTQYASDNNISFAFTYEDGVWKAHSKDDLLSQYGYGAINTISQGKGAWVYQYSGVDINIGNDQTLLSEGNFDTVTKLSSDDIEDIWNITFPIDISTDYTDFHIGVKFYKREDDGSDDIGEFVYKNISLQSGSINTPEMLAINGIGDSGSGSTYFNAGYDPSNIRANSILLNNNQLTLKLGLVMKSQTMVKEATFKVAEDYDIVIVSNVPIIGSSKDINITIIDQSKYDFSTSTGIEGRITIE